MLFWTLTLFSLAVDAVWAYQWQFIYGLLIFDEGKNLVNSSRTEVFFHSFVLINAILIFILKVFLALCSSFSSCFLALATQIPGMDSKEKPSERTSEVFSDLDKPNNSGPSLTKSLLINNSNSSSVLFGFQKNDPLIFR